MKSTDTPSNCWGCEEKVARKSKANRLILSWVFLSSCAQSSFNSESNKKTSVDPDAKIAGSTGAVILGDLFLGCSSPVGVLSADAIRANRLMIPYKCSLPKYAPPEASRGMDVMFVIDVTGSMTSQIDAVRSNFADLITGLVAQNWRLRIGAVAFSDTVEAAISLKENALDIVALTAPTLHQAWSTKNTDGSDKGGTDAPEAGLVSRPVSFFTHSQIFLLPSLC